MKEKEREGCRGRYGDRGLKREREGGIGTNKRTRKESQKERGGAGGSCVSQKTKSVLGKMNNVTDGLYTYKEL